MSVVVGFCYPIIAGMVCNMLGMCIAIVDNVRRRVIVPKFRFKTDEAFELRDGKVYDDRCGVHWRYVYCGLYNISMNFKIGNF